MKKLLIILLVLTSLTLFAEQINLTVHYHRYNGDYDGWGLHLWGAVQESGGTFVINGQTYDWQNAMPFSDDDSYGKVVTFLVDDTTPLGFIVHKGDEKDPPNLDRSFDDYDQTHEIWLLQGIGDIFYSEPSVEIRVKSAISDGINTINIVMTGTIDNYQSRFEIYKNNVLENTDSITETGSTVSVVLSDSINITQLYKIYDTEVQDTIFVQHHFPDDQYVYNGDDLGFTYSMNSTQFKLWSPTASEVNVLIYSSPSDDSEEPQSYPMIRENAGVFTANVDGELANKYYLYQITMYGETYTTPDPYSKCVSTNSKRSLIFDEEATNPIDWNEDYSPIFENLTDAIIYEFHIRDLTINDTWNGAEANRGKYFGVAETGTTYENIATGIDHIADLGVNCVQIQPFYDFGSVDETNPLSRNWGYDPMLYNTPEGSYASNPDNISRILETKSMIKAFHDKGIKVIMDVVYNHTFHTGHNSAFDSAVPNYYYIMNDDGEYENWTGCGNTVDSSKPMVQNFILQSVKYWVNEYHVDGFRFDLMGLINTDLMESVVDSLKEIKPDILVYGEPWGGWGSPILTGKGDQRSKGFGCFNDNIRNAIRGDTDGLNKGYAMGKTSSWNAVKKGVMGSINDFTDFPSETINYISAHDNYTWWDKLKRTVTGLPDDALIRMDKLGNGIVLTSQGIPFLHAGSEFLRTKRAPGATEEQVRNSYNANDAVNKLDWARLAENIEVNNYYKGLIELRKAHKEFRLTTADEIENHLHFEANNMNGVMLYTIDDVTPEDNWGDILVAYNPTGSVQNPILPSGEWSVVVNSEQAGVMPVTIGTSHYSSSTGGFDCHFEMPAYSMVVMYKENSGNINLNIFQNAGLNNYLHFAVNTANSQINSISVLANNTNVEMDSLAEGSWYGAYKMDETGNIEVSVTSNLGNSLIKNFAIGKVEPSKTYFSFDHKMKITFDKKELSTDKYFAILKNNENSQTDYYQIGSEINLTKNAKISIISDDKSKAIYEFKNGKWNELICDYLDQSISVKISSLGKFKIGKRTNFVNKTYIIGNYPNPFIACNNRGNGTKIKYYISQDTNVKIEIFNIKGQKIITLINDHQKSGFHNIIWNGKNYNNKFVGSGVLFYKLTTDNCTEISKMLLLK
jgi:pullulanase